MNEITPGEPVYAWKCSVCRQSSLRGWNMQKFDTEEEAEGALEQHLREHHTGKIAEVPSNWCACCFSEPNWT